ncbi:putative G-protein coupled receptor 139 [Rhinoraja longicauda]
MGRDLGTATSTGRKVGVVDRNATSIGRDAGPLVANISTLETNVFWAFEYLFTNYDVLTLEERVVLALRGIQPIYFPLLAIFTVPVNSVAIVILSRGKCGLSKCVTRYLVAMAAADLVIIMLDLVWRHIPMTYRDQFSFLWSVPVCNFHAVLLFANADCSVWFTVAFTFDRTVAICSQKLKLKYCTERIAAVVLLTVVLVSCLKNIFWFFMLTGEYNFHNDPFICRERPGVLESSIWAAVEFIHYLITPVAPFFLVMLFNVFTVRHIIIANRARRRLRGPSNGETPKDPGMDSRRKSIILLLAVSGNFILLWLAFMVHSIWNRVYWLGYRNKVPPEIVQRTGFVLQHLSCCTNTGVYALAQTKFREQLGMALIYPITRLVRIFK